MTERFVLQLWHPDQADGVVQSFGPYGSRAEAQKVQSKLSAWPAISGFGYLGRWTIQPLEPTSGSPGQDVADPVDPSGWTPEVAANIRARFLNGEACQHCKGIHARACPRVRTMTFHPTGALASVEFWREGLWSDAHIIWPEEVPDLNSEETP